MYFASYSGERCYGGYSVKDFVIEISKTRWKPEISVDFKYKYSKREQRGGAFQVDLDVAQCLATAMLMIRNDFTGDDKYISIEVSEDKIGKVEMLERRKFQDAEPE